MSNLLEIKDLHVEIEGREILKGVNLVLKEGEIHAIMGPNGSGKSTLAYTIMGHPKYQVTKGDILLNGKSILELKTDERARAGLFLGFQHPQAISGVTLSTLLRTALTVRDEQRRPPNIIKFSRELKGLAQELNMNPELLQRYVNEGFSGGERKKNEVLQMLVLKPIFALLDEPDSGLDVDALRDVSKGINKLYEETNAGILLITHYQRILSYVKPHKVTILKNGLIVKTGGPELAAKIEEEGYEGLE